MNKEFVNGLFAEKPSEHAPDFVKCKLSIKVENLIGFLKEKQNKAGYVNVDILENRAGKYYAKLNDYKSQDDSAIGVPPDEPGQEISTDELKDDEINTGAIPF